MQLLCTHGLAPPSSPRHAPPSSPHPPPSPVPLVNKTESFFPAMRLLLPQVDKDRLAYGMKEVREMLWWIVMNIYPSRASM